MNTVWNSYGQLLQLPEKTSKKMQIFCRGLDIRVPEIMNTNTLDICLLCTSIHLMMKIALCHFKNPVIRAYTV